MLLNCGIGEESWESLGLQIKPVNPKGHQSSLEELMLKLKAQYFGHLWELTHWKRPWCWERLKARGEGDDRGWDGWMVSLTQWAWVWVSYRSWCWTAKPGVLQSMGSQRVGHHLATEQKSVERRADAPLEDWGPAWNQWWELWSQKLFQFKNREVIHPLRVKNEGHHPAH